MPKTISLEILRTYELVSGSPKWLIDIGLLYRANKVLNSQQYQPVVQFKLANDLLNRCQNQSDISWITFKIKCLFGLKQVCDKSIDFMVQNHASAHAVQKEQEKSIQFLLKLSHYLKKIAKFNFKESVTLNPLILEGLQHHKLYEHAVNFLKAICPRWDSSPILTEKMGSLHMNWALTYQSQSIMYRFYEHMSFALNHYKSATYLMARFSTEMFDPIAFSRCMRAQLKIANILGLELPINITNEMMDLDQKNLLVADFYFQKNQFQDALFHYRCVKDLFKSPSQITNQLICIESAYTPIPIPQLHYCFWQPQPVQNFQSQQHTYYDYDPPPPHHTFNPFMG